MSEASKSIAETFPNFEMDCSINYLKKGQLEIRYRPSSNNIMFYVKGNKALSFDFKEFKQFISGIEDIKKWLAIIQKGE